MANVALSITMIVMERVKKIAQHRVMRFGLVGVFNTACNFAILNAAYYGLHQSKLVSSFIATSIAVLFSFFLNRGFVFNDKSRPARQLLMFIVVTLSGILIVQNSIYATGILLLRGHEQPVISFVHGLTAVALSKSFVDINLSNVMAAIGVMIWSYNGYRMFVFKGEKIDAVAEPAAS